MNLAYQRMSVPLSEPFPSAFPFIQDVLVKIESALQGEQAACKTEMIISFVKDHAINSKQVKDHPALAIRISSGVLPLELLEDLFEAGNQNKLFRKQLEDYIRSFFDRKAAI